jgi:hypothetical protein
MGYFLFFVLGQGYTPGSHEMVFFLFCIMGSWAGMGWQALSGMRYYKIQPWDLLHGVPGGIGFSVGDQWEWGLTI